MLEARLPVIGTHPTSDAWGVCLSPERVVQLSKRLTGVYGLLAISMAFLAQLLGQSLVKMSNAGKPRPYPCHAIQEVFICALALCFAFPLSV